MRNAVYGLIPYLLHAQGAVVRFAPANALRTPFRSAGHAIQCCTEVPFPVVNDASFTDLVLDQSATGPVLLAVGATWCGPCKIIEPHLRALNLQGEVSVKKVVLSGDDAVDGICRYLADCGHKIAALPVCFLIHQGELLDALVGRFSKKQLDSFLLRQTALKGRVHSLRSTEAQRGAAALSSRATTQSQQQSDNHFERIQDLDPRIQERIRAAAAASTCTHMFGSA